MQQFANILTSICLALAVVFTPMVATAQSASEPQSSGVLFDQEHRQRIYEARKLEYGTAALWSLAPGFGNFYVDQYLLGALAIISTVFAGFFIGYGVSTDQPDLLWTGVGIGGVTYAWSFGTTMWGVGLYNDELKQNLHLDKPSKQSGLQLSVRW